MTRLKGVIFSIFSAVVFSCISCCCFLLFASKEDKYTKCGEFYGLEGDYIYNMSIDEFFYSTYEERISFIKQMNSLKSVEYAVPLHTFGNGFAVIEDESYAAAVYINWMSYDYNCSELVLPVITTDGRLIDSLAPNEVLLDETAQDMFSIGDTFVVEGLDYENSGTIYYELTVAGYFSDDTLVIQTMNNDGSLTGVFNSVHDNRLRKKESIDDPDIPIYMGFASVFSKNGKEYPYSDYEAVELLISLKDGYSLEDLKSEAEGVVDDTAAIVPYDYYKQNYIEALSVKRKPLVVLSIVCLIASGVSIVVCYKLHSKNEN